MFPFLVFLETLAREMFPFSYILGTFRGKMFPNFIFAARY